MKSQKAMQEKRTWVGSAAGVLVVHAVVLTVLMVASVRSIVPHPEEPVVLVELPPLSAIPAPQTAPPETIAPEQPKPPTPTPERQVEAPEMSAPPVNAPLPREAVVAAPPGPPQPVRSERAAAPVPTKMPAAPAAAPAASAPSPVTGNDPHARQQEADYFSLVNAHLARNKRYPREARQARQEGVVTVRFTVGPDGTVSNASIRVSSGHELLDQATLDLLRRVSPLPRFPRSMTRDSVTLTLPIEYSLRTS
ncbi:energy transducer TonB [Alteraurantiacibacter palmitatis]|uniref:Protein TonB n=1 Tax=Alteraurantiacibacter palmitatis TaxID=2054628 RepID=A0ABV7EBM0_9SPHN